MFATEGYSSQAKKMGDRGMRGQREGITPHDLESRI